MRVSSLDVGATNSHQNSAIAHRVLIILGFLMTCASLIAWFSSQSSVASESTMPLVSPFPTTAGTRVERRFHINSAGRYVIRVWFKPDNLREFEALNRQMRCDIDVRINRENGPVFEKRVDRLELAAERGGELGYRLVWTEVLLKGEYSLGVDNHQDIEYQSSKEPELILALNPAELETRIVTHEVLKYVCPIGGLIGATALLAGFARFAATRKMS